jgi:putative peptidoglycan lipid II flippase
MSDSKRQLSRFTAIFAGGTLLSRVVGMARDMVVAWYVPSASRDAFLFAFKLPNMLRDMLGEGAANAAFVPVFSESQEKDSPAEYRNLVSACMSAMLIVFGLLTLLGVLAMPLLPSILDVLRPLTSAKPKDVAQVAMTVHLMQWTFPYLFLIGMAVFAMAPLFTARHYGTPSWSPVLLNVALIATCLLFHNRFPDPAWALVAGVWLGGAAQLIVMWLAMKRHVGVVLPNFHLRHPGVLKVFWLLGPVILGQATGEVNKLVDNFFAYSLPDGTVTALFYANRLVQLPLSIFGMAVAVAILPSISRAGARNDTKVIRETLIHGLRQSCFLVLPSMVGIILLGEPIIRLLFQRWNFGPEATERTAAALTYYGLGLLAFAWVKVSLQGFYAVQNTKTPVIIASASMFLNILLNCVLVGPMGFRGLALATTLSFWVNFGLLYAFLCSRFGPLWDTAMFGALFRMALATLIMGAVAYGLSVRLESAFGTHAIWAQLAAVVIPTAAAGVIYGGLCYVFRIPELRHFASGFRRG